MDEEGREPRVHQDLLGGNERRRRRCRHRCRRRLPRRRRQVENAVKIHHEPVVRGTSQKKVPTKQNLASWT